MKNLFSLYSKNVPINLFWLNIFITNFLIFKYINFQHFNKILYNSFLQYWILIFFIKKKKFILIKKIITKYNNFGEIFIIKFFLWDLIIQNYGKLKMHKPYSVKLYFQLYIYMYIKYQKKW